MNEQERLTVLQKLSSGEISAEKAARLLSGEEELTTVVEVEVKPEPVEVDVDDEIEEMTPSQPHDIKVKMVVKPDAAAMETVMEDEPEEAAQTQAHVIKIKMDEEHKRMAKSIRFSAIDDSGKLDIDIVIPVPLLKLGQQIGDRFAPTLDGWDWHNLDFDINLDSLHVRVAAE